MNPLLSDWGGASEGGLPPFSMVRAEHFEPAFHAAMAAQRAEFDAIAADPQPPSFANTAAALDASGRWLGRVEMLFHTLNASRSTPELQAVQRCMAAPLAAHASWVAMHQGVFARLDDLLRRVDSLGLDAEARRLLERLHLEAVRAGARLGAAERQRCAELMQELAELNTRFAQNVMADEAGYQLVLRSEAELAGLPEFARAVMRQAAAERGLAPGDHLVSLSRSHIVPFLTFSARRDLREQAWRAWVGRGENAGETDNRAIAQRILSLRNEQARLHGQASFADYQLLDTMAGSKGAVQGLLQRVWDAALSATERERDAVRAAALAHGATHALDAWDWRYYAEKVRALRYELDESVVKAYFPLERMVEAVFDCANRLFGLSFEARPEIRAYHPDVKVYEVRGRDGAQIGVFLHDNFARPSKRSGAWMSNYRQQSRNTAGGSAVTPIVVNNNNFAKGAPGEPTLLSFDDARTLFHEFGHGLHGLLSSVTYERLSGTNVLRDFVELPSQLFEHWLTEPEVLKKHARHHRTGEAIPDALVAKLHAARRFNQGYETVRYTASALCSTWRCTRRPQLKASTSAMPSSVPNLQRMGLARGRGPEPPVAALPAPVLGLQLRRGLLRLPVGGGARRRRLRCLRRGRQPVRRRHRGALPPPCAGGRQRGGAGRDLPRLQGPRCTHRAHAQGARAAAGLMPLRPAAARPCGRAAA
jgi:peptidyl-dipeptidase Dcp